MCNDAEQHLSKQVSHVWMWNISTFIWGRVDVPTTNTLSIWNQDILLLPTAAQMSHDYITPNALWCICMCCSAASCCSRSGAMRKHTGPVSRFTRTRMNRASATASWRSWDTSASRTQQVQKHTQPPPDSRERPGSTRPVIKVQFLKLRSSESWINNISIDVWFGQYLRIRGCQKNLNIEKIIFKVVQIKFLAMHFINQKLFLWSENAKYLHGAWS